MRENGFTLLEITIILVIISVLTLPFLQEYKNYIYNTARINTSAKQGNLIIAVNRFFEQNGYYPCPADPTVDITNIAFGTPDCSAALSVPPRNVLYGAVPIQVLGLETDYVIDLWGNQMTYGVTQALTSDENPGTTEDGDLDVAAVGFATVREMGAITNRYITSRDTANRPSVDILSADPAITIVSPPARNHAVIISHGPTGVGAYNTNGNLVAACPTAGTSHDRENCDLDSIIHGNTDGLDESNIVGVDFYDDRVSVFSAVTTPSWSFMQSDGGDTYSYQEIVGINTDDPMGEITTGVGAILSGGNKKSGMDIGGTILVENTGDADKNGQVLTDEVCSETGKTSVGGDGDCFNPQIIAGAGINCGVANGAIRGVANNNAVCYNFVPINIGACPTGEYIVEIRADGTTRCDVP